MSSLLLRCSPCRGRPAAVSAGCAAFPQGCVGADLNGDGCFSAAEYAYILRHLVELGNEPAVIEIPMECGIDTIGFPSRPTILPCRLDCNRDGIATATDFGILARLRAACPKCADCTDGAPPTGCAALHVGCPVADVDFDGCIRPNEEASICSILLQQ